MLLRLVSIRLDWLRSFAGYQATKRVINTTRRQVEMVLSEQGPRKGKTASHGGHREELLFPPLCSPWPLWQSVMPSP